MEKETERIKSPAAERSAATKKGEQVITFEEVRRDFAIRHQWQLEEATFQVLNETTWIAKIVGKPIFLLVKNGREEFALAEETLPALLEWCLKRSDKER